MATVESGEGGSTGLLFHFLKECVILENPLGNSVVIKASSNKDVLDFRGFTGTPEQRMIFSNFIWPF